MLEDAPPPPTVPSLVDRVARTRPTIAAGGRAAALGVALLLALAPVLTIVGARVLEQRAAAQTARLEARAEAGGAIRAARETLRGTMVRPSLGGTLDHLARALPADATLRSAARDASGALTVDVETLDPDRLRAALRRDPGTAGLRDSGQQRGEGGMVVTLVEATR